MFGIYDVSRELTFERDYKPLPELSKLNCTELNDLYFNLTEAEENAFLYGSDLLYNALYDDICRLQRERVKLYVCTVSSGYLAYLIRNTAYSEIDKAVYLTLDYIEKCDNDILYVLGKNPENMDILIVNCYTGNVSK